MPTNEAMKAAEYLYHHAWMDEDGVLRVPGGTAETIDRETNLPALLAVAGAARELVRDIERYENQDGNFDYKSYRCLRAAIDALPAPNKITFYEVRHWPGNAERRPPEPETPTPPPPGADENWGLEA